MQPEAPKKPVMDVMAPRPTGVSSADQAPGQQVAAAMPGSSPALPMHEPPKAPEDYRIPASQPPAEPAPSPKEQTLSEKPAATQPGPHKQSPPLPAGAITMALLVMAALAGITVIAYLKTK